MLDFHTERSSRIGIWQEGRPGFEPGEADIEAAKLKKFGDADGSQIERQTDAARTDF